MDYREQIMTMTASITLTASSGDWTTASECNPGDIVETESGKAYIVVQLADGGRIGRVEVGVRDED